MIKEHITIDADIHLKEYLNLKPEFSEEVKFEHPSSIKPVYDAYSEQNQYTSKTTVSGVFIILEEELFKLEVKETNENNH